MTDNPQRREENLPAPPEASAQESTHTQPREISDALATPDVHYMHAPIMREKAEPRDGHEPVPIWLTTFYAAVIFWGGYYLASYNGGFDPTVYDEQRPAAGAVTEEKKADPIALGKRSFTSNCAGCHQQSGKGVPGQFPPLAESEWVTGEPAILTRILLHGLQGPIEVKGEKYNGNMPAFGERLDDEQLAYLLTYIRQDWGNQASPLSKEFIAKVRENEQSRKQPWTVSELESVEPEAAPEKQEEPAEESGDASEGGKETNAGETKSGDDKSDESSEEQTGGDAPE